MVGGAFGHGRHPSTSLALALMALEVGEGSRVLDFGTGTGVLTMAAAAFGATRLVAVDNDPEALLVARSNLATIEPPASVELVEQLGPPTDDELFDVIVANVLLPVHAEHGSDLVDRLSGGGALIISGVLDEQESDVLAAYRGLQADHRHHQDDWLALCLKHANVPERPDGRTRSTEKGPSDNG